MSAVRCILPAACRMLSGSSLLHAACRWLHFPRRMLRVVCHIFPDAGCMLSIVCCTISLGRLRHAVFWIVSACPFFVAVARSPLHVVCCLLPVPVSHVAWCALSVAWSHVASHLLHVMRCESSVARCIPPSPCCLLSLVPSCMLYVACRLLPVAEWHSAVTHAAHRGGASQLSASVAGEARCSADRGARACVRACMPACG